VLRLILDRKLEWVGRHADTQGYMSALVDVDEVRAKVRGTEKAGFTGLELKEKLSTTAKVASALIKYGYLATITVINPVNRCPTVVVPEAEVERFSREYVSLFALARQRGMHHLAMKKLLEDDAIEPALDSKKIGATFYRRKDCFPSDAGTAWT
jgi:adenylylsulfate kinase-like enzyme